MWRLIALHEETNDNEEHLRIARDARRRLQVAEKVDELDVECCSSHGRKPLRCPANILLLQILLFNFDRGDRAKRNILAALSDTQYK